MCPGSRSLLIPDWNILRATPYLQGAGKWGSHWLGNSWAWPWNSYFLQNLLLPCRTWNYETHFMMRSSRVSYVHDPPQGLLCSSGIEPLKLKRTRFLLHLSAVMVTSTSRFRSAGLQFWPRHWALALVTFPLCLPCLFRKMREVDSTASVSSSSNILKSYELEVCGLWLETAAAAMAPSTVGSKVSSLTKRHRTGIRRSGF